MSEELDSFQTQGSKDVPNGTAVLVLGIIAVLHKKDKAVYLTSPAVYQQSFKIPKLDLFVQ